MYIFVSCESNSKLYKDQSGDYIYHNYLYELKKLVYKYYRKYDDRGGKLKFNKKYGAVTLDIEGDVIGWIQQVYKRVP